jgi:hypothetical protein
MLEADMAITHGRLIEFGVKDPLPLRGFPPGRARIRQRNAAATVVFIRPPEGGIRRFVVEPRDGAWWPAFETGANRNGSNMRVIDIHVGKAGLGIDWPHFLSGFSDFESGAALHAAPQPSFRRK